MRVCVVHRYPNDAQQRAFLAAYAAGDEAGAASASEAEVEALAREANVFSLASHLYWGVWALIQAKCDALFRHPAHAGRAPRALHTDRPFSLPLQRTARGMHGVHAQLGGAVPPSLTHAAARTHRRRACSRSVRVCRRYSAIDFDYLEYHGLRMAEFRRRKHAVLAAAAAAQS